MKKITLLLIFTFSIFLPSACRSETSAIPTGKWDYSILLNGSAIGTAVYTNQLSGENYISSIEMKMKSGSVENSVFERIEETKNFVPVRLEIVNRIKSGDNTQEEKTVSTFSKNSVELDSGGVKSSFTIGKTFHLEGNYITSELIKRKFAEGSVIKINLYDPTIEPDDAFPVTIKVAGRKNVSINGREENLVHIIYSIENVKSIDMYVDERGISRKSVIQMLNNRMEMVIKK